MKPCGKQQLMLAALVFWSTGLLAQEPEWRKAMDEGKLQREQGHNVEAERSYRRAIAAAEAMGNEDSRLALSLNSLGSLSYDRAQYGPAEPLFRRALSILEKTEAGSRSLMVCLNNLAQLYQAEGRLTEAESLLTRALSIGGTADQLEFA